MVVEGSSSSEAAETAASAEDDGGASKKKKKKRQAHEVIKVDLSGCKYEILRIAIRKMGWEEALPNDKTAFWHLFWTDTSIGPERLMTLKRGQKVNHFFGMLQICRKKSLARHLGNMRRLFPSEYRFFPRAFILPNHINDLIAHLNSSRQRTYILKPDNGCQGRGVVLVQSVADLKQAVGGMAGANMLAQKYLANPMLINGFKFDLRIYVLILSCSPLRLFLYREGIARFCTEKYMKPDKGNLKLSCMHLTNYAVNKMNPNFEFNANALEMDKGSKWALTSLFKVLAARGNDTGKLKRQIKQMVVMTVIAIVPLLVHNYKNCLNEDDNGRSCFELLGMDVLLDDKCKPWLLEVNHSPSFAIDTPLDFKIKEALLSDTLRLVGIDPYGVSRFRLQDKRNAKMRLYGASLDGCKENLECRVPKAVLEEDHEEEEEEEEDNVIIRCENNTATTTLGSDEYELRNRGSFDRIYPTEDTNLQGVYDSFLAGSEEAFKQSFDMKVKSAILKVQEERKKEEIEKEVAEKRKAKRQEEMKKRAQESARLVAKERALAARLQRVPLNAEESMETESPVSGIETPVEGWDHMMDNNNKSSFGIKLEPNYRPLPSGPVLHSMRKFPNSEHSSSAGSLKDSSRLQMEISDQHGLLRSTSSLVMHTPTMDYTRAPLCSSLPRIFPKSYGRQLQLIKKPCILKHPPKNRLSSEFDMARKYCVRSIKQVPNNLQEDAHLRSHHPAFLLAQCYYGRLPKLIPFTKGRVESVPIVKPSISHISEVSSSLQNQDRKAWHFSSTKSAFPKVALVSSHALRQGMSTTTSSVYVNNNNNNNISNEASWPTFHKKQSAHIFQR